MFSRLILNLEPQRLAPGCCINVLRAGSCYLRVTVIEQHQGGVDDLSIHVRSLALPVPGWRLGVNPLVELIFAPAPQHHLQATRENDFRHE